jgi:predicted SnoaL-like aldol condensation-catalyzing enzyme
VVLHIVRDLLEAGRWSEAPKYLTQRYIQHNPNVASGLEPVMRFFRGMPTRPIPKKSNWRMKVVSVVAEGDLVVVAIVRELPHPREKGKTYTTTWFDMWRIKDGKADEHWDGATINAAPPSGGRSAAPTAQAPLNSTAATQAPVRANNGRSKVSMSSPAPQSK